MSPGFDLLSWLVPVMLVGLCLILLATIRPPK